MNASEIPSPADPYFRTVGFGTTFLRVPGMRTKRETNSAQLYSNEIVVDVGGTCSVAAASDRASEALILDHHFATDGQLPSATALVLVHARAIKSLGISLPHQPVWIVTHEQPDFDALCSAFLAREVLEGSVPADGWDRYGIVAGEPNGGKIKWFSPSGRSSLYDAANIGHVWPLILAAFASRTDQGKPVSVRPERRLDSVLQAGIVRGRLWESDGGVEFFNWVRDTMRRDKLNPLFDDIFAASSPFEAELALLDGERERYERDIKKARRTMVTVQAEPFEKWFPEVEKIPLLLDNDIDERHLALKCKENREPPRTESFDGLFIRDPESLLFKHWARPDTQHTKLGRGFTFMAVAYSHGRPAQPESTNTTDYWFTLDQERCGTAHLYNVWAMLQAAEQRLYPNTTNPAIRPGFEGRQVATKDPWFDGANYHCTLVGTPGEGVLIETELKTASDLRGDKVSDIVARQLEYGAFGGASEEATIEDFPLDIGDSGTPPVQRVAIGDAVSYALREGCYRFVSVRLVVPRGQAIRDVARHVGARMWPYLERAGIETVPHDFESRHLFCYEDRVVIWSRTGLAVAYVADESLPGSGEPAQIGDYRKHIENFVKIRREIQSLVAPPPRNGPSLNGNAASIAKTQREAAALRLAVGTPESVPVRRLLEAAHLEELLATLAALEQQESMAVERERDNNERERDKDERERDNKLQHTLALVAGVGILLSWMQVQRYELDAPIWVQVLIWILALGLSVLFLRRKTTERAKTPILQKSGVITAPECAEASERPTEA